MTNLTRYAVVGYFPDEKAAREAIDDLITKGFERDEIHISSSTDYATNAAAGGAALTGRETGESHHGFMGWLHSLFGSDDYDDDSQRYTEALRRGGCVVAVQADDQDRDEAAEVLNNHGATDVDQNKTESAQSSASYRATGDDRQTKQSIPVVRENLEVGKRMVQRGGVRVYSHVVEEPVEEKVNLREEKVRVDRQRVDRPLAPGESASLRDQTIEVKETAEEPVVRKTARVVEEVRVGKEATERTETVRDTLRHTEVETEPLAAEKGRKTGSNYQSQYDDDFRRDFESRYASSGGDYLTYAPAYQYGYTSASDARYSGRNWDEIEPTLRSDYARTHPNSSWDQVKGAVRHGWDKVTRKI